MRPTLLCLVLLSLPVAGCGQFVDDDRDMLDLVSLEAYEAEREALVADLAAEIGGAEASDIRACRTVAVGAKACGGPASYAVYSAEASDPDAVERIAAVIRQLDDQANRQFGLMSDCAVVGEPTVVVVEGRCEGQPRR